MNHHFIAIWIAGLLIGTGGGMIIARSLPAASNHPQPENTKTKQPGGNLLFQPNRLGSQPYLTDPLQFPKLPPQTENSQFLFDEQSEPAAPRPFPQGKASPVIEQKQSQAEPQKLNISPEFRKQLEEVAPEFSEKAINDLAKIRSIIEKDEKAIKPKNKPAEKEDSELSHQQK